jgi:hypothetical protein
MRRAGQVDKVPRSVVKVMQLQRRPRGFGSIQTYHHLRLPLAGGEATGVVSRLRLLSF